jgi:UDP-glucose 4-epimerase
MNKQILVTGWAGYIGSHTVKQLGDPASLVACADRITQVLGWKPRYADLETIVRTALDWEKKSQI